MVLSAERPRAVPRRVGCEFRVESRRTFRLAVVREDSRQRRCWERWSIEVSNVLKERQPDVNLESSATRSRPIIDRARRAWYTVRADRSYLNGKQCLVLPQTEIQLTREACRKHAYDIHGDATRNGRSDFCAQSSRSSAKPPRWSHSSVEERPKTRSIACALLIARGGSSGGG